MDQTIHAYGGMYSSCYKHYLDQEGNVNDHSMIFHCKILKLSH